MALSGWEGVLVAPDDDEPRLVLADQLLARGDPLGEFITLSCRQARLGAGLDAGSAGRLAELWRAHGAEFQSRFGGGDGLTLHFSRGLPSRLVASAADWLEAGELPAPIQRLELSDVERADLAPLAARPGLARLTSLTLRRAVGPERWAVGRDTGWSENQAALLGAIRAPGLRHLALHWSFASPAGFVRLLSGPLAQSLDTLELGGNLWGDTEEALAPLLRRARPLRRLTFGMGPPGLPAALHALGEPFTFRERFGPMFQLRRERPTRAGFTALRPLGLRPGLEADEAESADGRRALWLRASTVNADVESPRRWFDPPDAGDGVEVGVLHAGDDDDGLFQLVPVPEGPPVDELGERRALLTPVEWAAAVAPLAQWAAGRPALRVHTTHLFLAPDGLRRYRLSPDFAAFPFFRDEVAAEQVARFSPEELRGERPTPQTTVYALAALVCELSQLELVPAARSTVAMMQAVLTQPAQVRRADVPGELAALLEQALAKQPAARPSPAELAERLARFRSPQTARAPERVSFGTPAERAEQLARLWLETRSVHEREPIT